MPLRESSLAGELFGAHRWRAEHHALLGELGLLAAVGLVSAMPKSRTFYEVISNARRVRMMLSGGSRWMMPSNGLRPELPPVRMRFARLTWHRADQGGQRSP